MKNIVLHTMLRPTHSSSKYRIGGLLAAAICLAGLGTFEAAAQSAPHVLAPSNGKTAGKTITMDVGRSRALQTDWLIKRVSIADPSVADVEVLEPTEILIVSKGIGATDLIIWGEEGEVWSAEINVDIDPGRLNDDLNRLFPRCSLNVTRSEDVYFIAGILERAEQVQQLHSFLDVAEVKYVDMTKLAGLHQVQIQVRVAEVNRRAIKRMGINALYGGDNFFGASLTGSASGGPLNPVNIGVPAGSPVESIPFTFLGNAGVSPFVTLLAGFPGADLEFFIQALAENQYLRILAEPTLVALSGEEASFLAGGEFPIPVVQGGSGGGGGTSVTIEYKEFGVRLQFSPTVLGDGTIRLHVAPEVSELSDIGALRIEGFSIPSVLTRRAETTLELRSGQTFTMAGLLSQSTNTINSRVPFLGDLPVLGSLFRSVSYQTGETELVVLVTATLVEPLSYGDRPALPGDTYIEPNDWEIYWLGNIEGRAAKADPKSPDSKSLTQLKGPGAWASHRENRAQALPSAAPGTAKLQTNENTEASEFESTSDEEAL